MYFILCIYISFEKKKIFYIDILKYLCVCKFKRRSLLHQM